MYNAWFLHLNIAVNMFHKMDNMDNEYKQINKKYNMVTRNCENPSLVVKTPKCKTIVLFSHHSITVSYHSGTVCIDQLHLQNFVVQFCLNPFCSKLTLIY